MRRRHFNGTRTVIVAILMMIAAWTRKPRNVASSFSLLRTRNEKIPFLSTSIARAQLPPNNNCWVSCTVPSVQCSSYGQGVHRGNYHVAAAIASNDDNNGEDDTTNNKGKEDEAETVSNAERRRAAFDAILFDDSKEAPAGGNAAATTISSTGIANGPKASSQPPPLMNDDYGDSFSPFDFSDLEEEEAQLPAVGNGPATAAGSTNNANGPKASSQPPPPMDDSFSPFDFSDLEEEGLLPKKTLEKEEEEYPVHPEEEEGYSLAPNIPPSVLEATVETPLVDDKEMAEASTKTSLPPINGGSFRERHSLDILQKASNGNGIMSDVHVLEARLQQLETEIYAQNNGNEFNINSPKQVANVLFGSPSQSTNKATLEAMGAAGNRMADLILKYRKCSRDIKRAIRRADTTTVKNVMEARRKQSEVQEETENALLLVDASAYIFRAYYSMPPIHRSDGMPVGAVLGFCNMLNRLVLHRLLKGERPRLVLVFDAKGKTFRNDLYDGYKANRKECPMDLVPQFDLIRQVAEAYGIQQLEANNYEADDVIATLTSMAIEEGVNVNILSGDKDLMQLVTPEEAVPSVHMIDPMKMSRITHDVVVEKWGVPPDLVGDILALAGDASDNIPGVPGIGPKIAAQLLEQFGSLDSLLENAETIPQKARRQKILDNKDKALLSKQLVELERQIPLQNMTFPLDLHGRVADLRTEGLDPQRLLQLYEQMGFKDLKRRFRDRLVQRDRRNANAGAPSSTTATVKAATAKRRYNKRPKAGIPQPEDYDQVPF